MVLESQSGNSIAAQDASELPRAFGNYLLFDRIGRGGMAEIFLARLTTELGGARRIVIKEVLPELSQDKSFSRMLVSEAKLAAQLNHRNIVQVIDLGRESGRLFIAMEYVEGFDLNQLLRQLSTRRLALPAEFALFMVREVLAALDYAHRATDADGMPLGIVHRDVSPSNVLISFEGEVNLCDFGIARALNREADANGQGSQSQDESRIQRVRLAGKSAYMSPEHAAGNQVDVRSDVFAASILLWELCAGRRLYKGSEQEMIEMAKRGDVQALPDRRLPEQAKLQSILDRGLAVDPTVRYQSAGEMLQELDEYVRGASMMASQLRFGAFLTDHFADEIVSLRRTRERAAEAALTALDMHITEIEPVTLPSDRPPSMLKSSVPELDDEPMPTGRSSGGVWIVAAVVTAVLAAAFALLR